MESSAMNPLVAVAGATGNAGKEIVRAAHASGLRVRALVRSEARLQPVRECVDEVRVVQVTEPESVAGCLEGAAYLVSALGKTYQKDRIPRRDVDVGANLHLFREAARAGVRRVLLVSVFGADPRHEVALVRMKGEVEEALVSSGLPFVIVQPTGFFSDMWELFQMGLRGTLWVFGREEVGFNPISLEDLGAFVVRSLLDEGKGGCRLPCGGPEVLTPTDIAAMVSRVTGRRVRVRHIPLWLARAGVAMVRPFHQDLWEMAQFFVEQATLLKAEGGTVLAPVVGEQRLEDYYRRRWAELQARSERG